VKGREQEEREREKKRQRERSKGREKENGWKREKEEREVKNEVNRFQKRRNGVRHQELKTLLRRIFIISLIFRKICLFLNSLLA